MLNKMSIRARITIITVLLLSLCCLGLTLVLNQSAYKILDAVPVTPATYNANKNISGYMHDAYSYKYNRYTYNHEPNLSQSLFPVEDRDEIDMIQTETAESLRDKYRVSSIEYMIGFILVGGGLMYFIIYKSLKPLIDLSNHIKDKSIENLSVEVPLVKSKDEIYDLTVAFNEMTNKLNKAFNMQKRFSNNAAHELRTPLTVMKTNLDVFKKKGNHTNKDYEELIESMSGQITRLSDLVSNLLDFTNMEDIDMTQEINLRTLIDFVKDDLYLVAQKKNIDINVAGELCKINGNQDLIYQALYNLVENSIKYNYENGSININLKNNIKDIEIEIKDTGIGIPEDMKAHIFEPFFTVDKSRSRKLGGAGIGLSIVKSVMDKHGASIEVKDNEDKGTIFKIRFS